MTKPFKATDWFALGNSGEPYPSKMAPMTNGVYAIRSKKSKQVLYVGESHTNHLYKTLSRHFQQWDGRDSTYDRSEVEVAWKVSKDPIKAEATLIGHYDPPDNIEKPRDYLPPMTGKQLTTFEQELQLVETAAESTATKSENPFDFEEQVPF